MYLRTIFLTLIFIFFHFSSSSSKPRSMEWTQSDSSALKALSGIIHLFKFSSDRIWPHYDLSKRAFIFYLPDRWTLFVNESKNVTEFEPYPKDWPNIGTPALFHRGRYNNLSGQLEFNYEIDSLQTVAIGLPLEMLHTFPHPEAYLFGFIAHEAFHQYQYDSFADIPWAREERYPILNNENIAYAYIEMQLLVDAVQSAYQNNTRAVEKYLKQFVAVRNYRWHHLDPFIKEFEQGLEIREGTAQYVQVKCLELFKELPTEEMNNELALEFSKDLASVSMPDYLIDDFQNRFSNNSVSPDDMARNRIYPVGSALGLLLDFLKIDWKEKAQNFPEEFEFATILGNQFHLNNDELTGLLQEAKAVYSFNDVLSSTKKVVEVYLNEYHAELDSFHAQSGKRIEISFSYTGISRSRSKSVKQYTIDAGRISFCEKYNLYKLKNDNLSFSIQNSGLYEENDWDGKSKRIVFYTPNISSLSLDKKKYDIDETVEIHFGQIDCKGSNFDFSYTGSGNISLKKQRIVIELE